MLNLFENTALKVCRTCNLGTSRPDPVQTHHGMTVWGYYGMTLNRAPNRSPEQEIFRAGSLGHASKGRHHGMPAE